MHSHNTQKHSSSFAPTVVTPISTPQMSHLSEHSSKSVAKNPPAPTLVAVTPEPATNLSSTPTPLANALPSITSIAKTNSSTPPIECSTIPLMTTGCLIPPATKCPKARFSQLVVTAHFKTK